MTQDIFILGGKRTPMTQYVGALKDVKAIDLGAAAARGALEATGVAGSALVGGMESMSMAPHVIYGARSGFGLGQGKLEDSLMVALLDTYCNTTMAGTAENLARKYEISREEQDAYALRSQQEAKRAQDAGLLAEEIVPVEVKTRKGVKPDIMGIGPVPAIRKALEKANLKLEDIDVVEVNEAFAGQYLAVEKELD